MADDEKDLDQNQNDDGGGDDGAGDADDVIVAGLDDDDTGGDDDQGGDGGGSGDGDQGGDTDTDTDKGKDVQTQIAEALEKFAPKKDDQDDKGKPAEKRTWTDAELAAAEDELDQKLEDEEITQAQWRKASRQIDAIRRAQDKEALTKDISATQKRETAERGITAWAKDNAPEHLDGRTSEAKAARAWADETLAPTKNADGTYTLTGPVFHVVAGLLHKGVNGGDRKAAEKQKADAAAAAETKRKEDLRKQGNPPGGKKTGKKGSAPTASEDENKVFDRLGLDASALPTYRKIQKAIGGKTLDVEVG